MGIPRLVHHLDAYATKSALKQQAATPSPQEATKAIIDGPSLAYHVYYVCLAQRPGARNALEAAPSYRELGQAAIWWLEQIEKYGLKVQAIHFDGLLPTSKKDVRLSRLQSYTNQLVTFRALNREDLPPRLASISLRPSDLLNSALSPTRLKALPAPTFLVPAVIEALLSSPYASLTSVVPGEADSYCAYTCRQTGGIIFTSDSDLLAHDLGPEGRVVLFRDIESAHIASKGLILKITEYHPAGIAARLNLEDLLKLAFFIAEDNHRSFTDCVRLAEEGSPDAEKFAEFRLHYATLPVYSMFLQTGSDILPDTTRSILARLDPRISELIHTIDVKAEPSSPARDLDVYLPVLIEDPTKTSAWRAGESIRRLAYSLVRLLDCSVSQIDEYERKGTRTSQTTISLLPRQDISAAATSMLSTIRLEQPRFGTMSTVTRWRVLAVYCVCGANVELDKPVPSGTELTRLVANTRGSIMSWSFIHASAQTQAALYSFRTLREILAFVLSVLRRDGSNVDTVAVLQELSGALSDLPSLMDMFDEYVQLGEGELEKCSSIVEELCNAFGVKAPITTGAKNKKKRKKKAGQGRGESNSEADVAWQKNNMYSSLV